MPINYECQVFYANIGRQLIFLSYFKIKCPPTKPFSPRMAAHLKYGSGKMLRF